MWFLSSSSQEDNETLRKLLKSISSDVEKLKTTTENQSLEIQRLKTNYVQWLEDKEVYIKQLRDRIEKKIDYANRVQDGTSLKQQAKEAVYKKTMRALGLNGKKTQEQNVDNQLS